MSKTIPEAQFVARRAELLVELFLQDLGATFVSVPTADIGLDFVVGFANSAGGMNFSAIEVKATQHPISASFPLEKRWYSRLANNNIPSMLLVVDVKENQLYCAWPSPDELKTLSGNQTVRVPVAQVNDQMKETIRERLAGKNVGAMAKDVEKDSKKH